MSVGLAKFQLKIFTDEDHRPQGFLCQSIKFTKTIPKH